VNELGIGQAGNAEAFLEVIDKCTVSFPNGITYVEIGVGSGGTLIWVAKELRKRVKDWRVIGIDIIDGYSFCAHSVVNNSAGDFYTRFIREEVSDIYHPQHWYALQNGITLVFAPAQAVFRRFWPNDLPIHIALIDGCHGRACVMGDFIAIEPHITNRGWVLFHDFGEDSVDEPQPHCGLGDTIGACWQLGLMDNSRKNWFFKKHSVADKSQNGKDLGVFQYIPDVV
jgi:hypothetical protein